MLNVRLLIGVLVITVLAAGVGCSEVKRSGSGLFRGEVGAIMSQPQPQVAAAIDAAFADLKLNRIGATTQPVEEKSKTETIVTARSARDVKVTVAYRPMGDGSTRVIVSTGAFGDSALRDQVWDAVRVRLGVFNVAATPPAGAPIAAAPATQPTADAQ
jgi:hypothetical protein